MHILVTGSSGLVGSTLVGRLLRESHTVTALVRNGGEAARGVNAVSWDPTAESLDLSSLGEIDAVVHLGGTPIAGKRWNPEYLAEIRDSRVRSTRLLSSAISSLEAKPPVMVVASAMGYYGDRGDELLAEDSGPGEGFLSEVAVEWERAADRARDAGIRVVHTRFGNVLSRHGGMVPRLKTPALTGVSGPIGSGRQWWPWVAVEDAARAITFMFDQPEISGPVNVVAPGITRQKEFAKRMARSLNRPAFIPLPAWALRLMVGGLSVELLSSQRMTPTILESNGFEWLGPDLETVFHHIFRAPSETEWR